MTKKQVGGFMVCLLVVALVMAGCRDTAVTPDVTPAPTRTEVAVRRMPEATPGRLVFSELLPGIPGNNNREFIELYNAGTEPVDLRGWSIWYQMDASQEAQLVYRWSTATWTPGYGHYLLVREKQDFGVLPDAVFQQPLFERRGGLTLRNAQGDVVDSLGWVDATSSFIEGSPATLLPDGSSVERLPGGEGGNGIDTGDNGRDFTFNPTPSPQNTGSPVTPAFDAQLALDVTIPETGRPGDPLSYDLTVTNQTGQPLQDLVVFVPVPQDFGVLDVPQDVTGDETGMTWALAALDVDAEVTLSIELHSPWTYGLFTFGGAYVEAPDWPLRTYAPLRQVAIAGGAIPIATARTLVGETVTVEGVATMYTGGFYAGSTGTKFYVEDETGGVQVYCPGGQGEVRVRIGERVRVSGKIEVYRNAVEIVPSVYPDDVEVLGTGENATLPDIDIGRLGSDEQLLGRAGIIRGILARIDEFSYNYEMDLIDEAGNVALLYVEKDTGIDVELLEVGREYQVVGIVEIYDDVWEFKPRRQSDFIRIFPPELTLELVAQSNIEPGKVLTYTLMAFNHTGFTLTNVMISASIPTAGVSISAILDEGILEGAQVIWTVPELAAGGAATVRYTVRAGENARGRIVSNGAMAVADQWTEPVVTVPHVAFVGAGVPVAAIQGPGMESPYVRTIASVEGVVTGVFPDLGGFWLQSLKPDDDPATSEGVFVSLPQPDLVPILSGDRIIVRGKVREQSGQTLLAVASPDDLTFVAANVPLPEAVPLDPPQLEAAAVLYYEALEGMLVTLAESAVAVAPTSQYGEYALVLARHGVERVMRGDPAGWLIFVDDGSSTTHLDRSTLPYAVQSGDTLADLTGPLAFTYDNYKIEPIITPTLTSQSLPLPVLEEAGAQSFSIATFNIENFFDFQDPNPADPPKPTLRQYQLRVTKAAEAIIAMGAPTIVALQEIENLGVLEDLAEEPALVDFGYLPVLIEGADSRGIDNGYLVRGDRATLEGARAYPAPEGVTSRPPLVITVTVQLGSGPQTVVVLNNHFTSMSGGESATEPRRDAQAAWNATLVGRILERTPQAMVAVVGDLNSFYQSRPLDTLRQAGLRHVYEFVAPARPYSYIFEGESETLDHILVTPSLYGHLARVVALHINADFPPPDPQDASARRVSDHDPVIAVFSFDGP